MSKEVPNVIVFDIDGTLIGDIEPQIMIYDLHNALKQRDPKINIIQPKEFRESLKNGIVRPYFIKFIKTIQESIPNTEFFIYTASEKKWAQFLVPHIEQACNCKFSRPILSRDNCVVFNREYKKKVDVIYKCIFKTLRKKYNVSMRDLEDKIMIIDNNVVYDKLDMKHVLLCPTYGYKKPENIPCYITEQIYNSHSQVILDVTSRYISSLDSAKDFNDFQRLFYMHFVGVLSHHKDPKDKFFLNLLNIIARKNISSFSPRIISYITNKIADK